MDEPSEAAKKRACELANAARGDDLWDTSDCINRYTPIYALALHLDKVDRVAREALEAPPLGPWRDELLHSLMLPDEPDPLREAWKALWPSSEHNLPLLRAELDKRGLTIAPKEQGRLTDAK